MNRRGAFGVVAIALLAACGGVGETTEAKIDLREVATQRAAARLRSPSVEILTSAVLRLPESGVTLHRFAFQAAGAVALVDLDDHGNEVDDGWAETERLARIAHHGRMDALLERAVSTMKPGERRWVLVHVPIEEPYAGAGSNLLRDPEALRVEEERASVAITAGIERILAMLPRGIAWSWPGGVSPFLSIRASAAEISALSRSNDVGRVYDAAGRKYVRASCDFTDPNTNQNVDLGPWDQYAVTNTTQVHQSGVLGTGIRIANMFDLVCPYVTVPFNPMDPTHARLPLASSCPANHGTIVMGYMQNTNPDDPESPPPPGANRGMAPSAELFWSNVSVDVDSECGSAYAWLRPNKIRIATASIAPASCYTNCSPPAEETWTAVSDYYATHAPFVLQLVAAGNTIDPGDPYGAVVKNQVHNGLIVGGATPCQSTYLPCDYSRKAAQTIDGNVYANPAPGYLEVGDHELPHIVSPASILRVSIDDPGGCGGAGTSYATPILAGAAALVADKNGALYGRPEALKAVLMAGADVNTDTNTPTLSGGPFTYQPRYNDIAFGTGVDRHGGVGLVNTNASVTIGRPVARFSPDNSASPAVNGHDYGVMDPTADFTGIWWNHSYYFNPGKTGHLRIVLAWNRPYTCTFGSGTPSCGPGYKPDLNIILRDMDNPTGSVSSAVTYDPNEEFLSAPVVAGKTYRLDVYKQNYWPGAESFGVASFLTGNPQ